MKRRQIEAIILALAEKLREFGSWCGETHLQKSCYLLENLTEVPLDLNFILYKHGPFSFDLHDQLTAMQADGLLHIKLQSYPYGPNLLITDEGKKLQKRWPTTLRRFDQKIKFIASKLSNLGVAELERLSTAFYVKSMTTDESDDHIVEQLCKLKPHISHKSACDAVHEISKVMFECKTSGT